MKNKIPTAEQFYVNHKSTNNKTWSFQKKMGEVMIKFAKLHTKAALEIATSRVMFDEEALIRQSILQAYPEENIK